MKIRPLLIAIAFMLVTGPRAEAARQLWFDPLTWSIGPAGRITYDRHDFPALLSDDHAWKEAATHVSVFAIPGNVVWSYPDIPGLISFIRRHNFPGVALTNGMLFDGGRCPRRLEGISHDTSVHQETVAIAAKWKAAGGRLDYVIMDAPLFFGHYFFKECSLPIPEIAKRVAATVAGIRQSFPAVQFVDAEGPGKEDEATWLRDMQTWFTAFKAETGTPIHSVVLDLHWKDLRPGFTWQDVVRDSVTTFGPLGIPTGIILDAQPEPSGSESRWRRDISTHSAMVANSRLGLSYVFIDQWHEKIRNNLPETDPDSWTSVILEYIENENRAGR